MAKRKQPRDPVTVEALRLLEVYPEGGGMEATTAALYHRGNAHPSEWEKWTQVAKRTRELDSVRVEVWADSRAGAL